LIPEKQKTYRKVFDIACKELLGSEYKEKFIYAGLTYTNDQKAQTVSIPFFDEIITINIPDFSFKSSKGTNITLAAKIMILHYINTSSGKPLSAEKITYEDIPGLRGYQPVFEKRAAKPLLSAFGSDRYAFLEAGMGLGGTEEDYGDASFTLYAFPKVPITFILWEGDSEFSPSLKILFDSSIPHYLPLEDITVISKLASTRIIKQARINYSDPGNSC